MYLAHEPFHEAPTSAGKTFISFYAMEQILRESDDGVLVYVAPTKALVTQVAAEVYARFSKDVKNGKTIPLFRRPGARLTRVGSLWAIHTRDYRINDPQRCQILVTVPEMLSIMMLSPPLARTWLPRMKRSLFWFLRFLLPRAEGFIGLFWTRSILLGRRAPVVRSGNRFCF